MGAQRGGRRLVPENIQSKVWWGSEQPDPAEDISVHCRSVGLDDL